jgi:hypothetical protein
MNDFPGVSPMNNSSELKGENRDGPLCVGNLKFECLLDMLKQNQHSQEITGVFELMQELTRGKYDLDKRGISSVMLPLQLEDIFYKLLTGGYSEKGEQAGDLNQRSGTASQMVEEEPHGLFGDLKSKEENHCSFNSQTMKEFGLESSTACAPVLPRDEKTEGLGSHLPGHLECISGSKEMTSADSSREKVSHFIHFLWKYLCETFGYNPIHFICFLKSA